MGPITRHYKKDLVGLDPNGRNCEACGKQPKFHEWMDLDETGFATDCNIIAERPRWVATRRNCKNAVILMASNNTMASSDYFTHPAISKAAAEQIARMLNEEYERGLADRY